MTSLRSYFNIGLAISLLVIFSAQWVLVSVAAHYLAEAYLAGRLEHDMDSLLAIVTIDTPGRPTVKSDRVGVIYQRPFSGHYFRVTANDAVLRSRSLWDEDLPEINVALGEGDRRRAEGPQAQELLVLTKTFVREGQTLTISVAEELTPLFKEIRRFSIYYALVSLFALALLLVVQGSLVGRGLRSLTALDGELKRLEHGEIGELPEEAPDEVLPLVRELNRLLHALNRRLQRSRQALGNLAHALKTPLTLLTDLARQKTVSADPELSKQLETYTETIRRLIDRELKRARLAGASQPGRRLDLARELPALVETLHSIYRERDIEITYDLPPHIKVAADREDMLELLGNLLDNACKWAQGRVRLTVKDSPPWIIEIEDDGPGCPAEDLKKLVERGQRLDESTAGHGLGLAIAQDIVVSYHGSLEFQRSKDLGGLHVRVRLPNDTTQ